MTTKRTYNKVFRQIEAIAEINKHAGTQFDPMILKIFIEEVLNNNNEIV